MLAKPAAPVSALRLRPTQTTAVLADVSALPTKAAAMGRALRPRLTQTTAATVATCVNPAKRVAVRNARTRRPTGTTVALATTTVVPPRVAAAVSADHAAASSTGRTGPSGSCVETTAGTVAGLSTTAGM